MAGERVSTLQVLVLVVVTRITLTLVYFPTMSDPDLKQDAWLASLLGALWGIPFVWVLNLLWLRFPGQTLVEVAESVLGKLPGKALMFVYLLFPLLVASSDLRMTGEFFIFAFLPKTPIIVVIGTTAFLAAWGAKAGVEVIGRVGEVVFPLLIGFILLIFVLLLKDIQFSLLAPVFLQSGPIPHLKQMFSVVARNAEYTYLAMMVPFVDEPRGLLRAVVLAHLWMGVIWALMGVAVTGVVGPFQQSLYFPFFAAVRQISIADVVERIDAIVLGVWNFGVFLRVGLLLWAAALGFAQVLGLKEYRPLVVPFAGIAVSGAVIVAENFSELRGYLGPEIFTPFGLTFIWLIPALVLLVAAVQGQRGRRESAVTPPTE